MAFENPFLVDKTVNSTVNNEITFDTDILFEKDFNADIDIDAFADIDGNISTLTLDAEAIGTDTLVEVDSSVLSIHGELSSVSLSVISAVAPKDDEKLFVGGALDVVGNTLDFAGTSTTVTFTIEFEDVDDRNTFGGLVGLLDPDPLPIAAGPGGVPDLILPALGLDFDNLDLDPLGVSDVTPGGNSFNYELDTGFNDAPLAGGSGEEAAFELGVFGAGVEVAAIPGDEASKFDASGLALELVIPDGAIFEVEVDGVTGDKSVVLVEGGDNPNTLVDEDAFLRIGAATYTIAKDFAAEDIIATVGSGTYGFSFDIPEIFHEFA
ncbi:hypothetical protein [Synechococcus sp. PCC 7336]|uniref:hypothetical protein n=1 Tax=Synechococcus sp. PCC 7336 TaxID=195250 RepID=UPI000347F53D|nr:hypothetical protein [Synechococcus sp. PCC 7336]